MPWPKVSARISRTTSAASAFTDFASACRRKRDARCSSGGAPRAASATVTLAKKKVRPTPEAFPKRVRLRTRSEYLAVQRLGRRVTGELFLVLIVNRERKDGDVETRVG